MSKVEQEEKKKSNDKNSRQRYENLNNNELKFKKKIPSKLNSREYDSYSDRSSDSYRNQRYSPHSRSNHKRYNSRSRSRSDSRERHSSKYRHSHYNDRKYDDYHRHSRHHRHRKHHRDYSDRKNYHGRSREEEEESMRREILKNNSINAFLQGKSSNIFYDDNYLPISSNPYKYLGKPGLEEPILDKLNEIPVSTSDICKKDFELYVVNLPQDLAEDQIKELLNTALISIEANEKKGEPITKVTKPKNGNYFILEFRSRSECKNAMKLNGMKILNRTLKIGIPNYINEKDGNNIGNNNLNNGTHDLFPILSSFEKEFDYKKGYGVDINSFTDYQNKINNLISGQNLLYNIPFMYSSSNLSLSEQKRTRDNSNEKTKPEPGTKLHIMNIPIDFNEEDICKLFKAFGKIKKIELIKDEKNNKFNGQCYLEYEEEKSYQNAINYGTGLKLRDNFLLINRINPKDDNKNNSTKINYLENGIYKSNSSLGILGSSINLQTYQKNKTNNEQ
jgi:RNA recognition motif-containing protein